MFKKHSVAEAIQKLEKEKDEKDREIFQLKANSELKLSEKLAEKEVKIGDKIREIHNNQQGTKVFEVKGKNGKKTLKLLVEDGFKFNSYTSDSSRSRSRSHSPSHSPSPSRKRRKTGGKRKTYKKNARK
jgi:hypothetical protein